jgi:hypothetical protein
MEVSKLIELWLTDEIFFQQEGGGGEFHNEMRKIIFGEDYSDVKNNPQNYLTIIKNTNN